MKLSLVNYSSPITANTGCKSMEDLIVYCARVSNPANQDNFDTSAKLINYLVEHKHWSPFEMVSMTLEINTTRDIARQILRHRSFSFQEFSQRYADPSESLGFEIRECRLQDPKNRQSSNWCSDEELNKWWTEEQEQIALACEDIYKQALRRGIAKEVARAILPEGLMKSKLYMNGTVRSWIHYCQVRMDETTQKEHREVAEEAYNILTRLCPSLKEI